MIDDSFLHKYYPKEKQEKFMKNFLLKYINFDSSWGYMGVSEHPFTDGFSANNVRITTAYNKRVSCQWQVMSFLGISPLLAA